MRLKVNTVNFQLPTPKSQQRTLGWLVPGNWKLGIGSFAKPTVVIALACVAVACRQDRAFTDAWTASSASADQPTTPAVSTLAGASRSALKLSVRSPDCIGL